MIYLLNAKEELEGVLNNSTPFSCPYYNDLHTENLETGVNTYEFTIPADHDTADAVDVEGYVLFPDMDGRLQMFQIKDIEEVGSEYLEKVVYCEHVAIPELMANPFRPMKMEGISMRQAAQLALQGSGWALGDYEWDELVELEISDYTNSLEVLFQLIDKYGLEIQYEVTFKNGVVTKREVHIREKLGNVTNKFFTYGKDLREVKRKVNSEDLVTAVIGVGPGDSDGARLTLSNYNPAEDNQFGANGGLPAGFEKPTEADWVGNTAALEAYGKDGKHRFGIFVDEESTNTPSLYLNTLANLKARMTPKTTYEMKLAILERATGYDVNSEEVRIGDTITVSDPTMNPRLLIEARIIELKRSYTQPENDECILGDYRPIKIATSSSLKKIQNKISANEEMWNNTPYIISINSSTGNAFKNGIGSTVLTCIVARDNKAVDEDGTLFSYEWRKYDKYGNLTKGWGGVTDAKLGKSITVTAAEIDGLAKIVPTVYIP